MINQFSGVDQCFNYRAPESKLNCLLFSSSHTRTPGGCQLEGTGRTPNLLASLPLNFPASRAVRNKSLVIYLAPCPCHFVRVAGMDEAVTSGQLHPDSRPGFKSAVSTIETLPRTYHPPQCRRPTVPPSFPVTFSSSPSALVAK